MCSCNIPYFEVCENFTYDCVDTIAVNTSHFYFLMIKRFVPSYFSCLFFTFISVIFWSICILDLFALSKCISMYIRPSCMGPFLGLQYSVNKKIYIYFFTAFVVLHNTVLPYNAYSCGLSFSQVLYHEW
uniref:Uncharacterized protein n=1 Tax=Rhipicephalus zambeziensis TaxID=60191 RepID=A0A224YG60_9ACAR